MPEFEVVEVPEQPTAVVRDTVPMAAIKELFDRAFQQVFMAIGKQGVAPAGAPFGLYPSPPGETIEVEAGVPVTRPIQADGDVQPGTVGGCRVVKGVHVGPYENLAATYELLLAWAGEQGLTVTGPMWECYLTDPGAEPDPAKWRTEICWAVAG